MANNNYRTMKQPGYSIQLKHCVKMLLPVICTSIIYMVCAKTTKNSSEYLENLWIFTNALYFITCIYNSIFLPVYLAYFNILKLKHVKRRIYDLLIIVFAPLLGNFIIYIFMYALVSGSLFIVPRGRDDITILFFLFPTVVGFIMSFSSFMIFEGIALIMEFNKNKKVS